MNIDCSSQLSIKFEQLLSVIWYPVTNFLLLQRFVFCLLDNISKNYIFKTLLLACHTKESKNLNLILSRAKLKQKLLLNIKTVHVKLKSIH